MEKVGAGRGARKVGDFRKRAFNVALVGAHHRRGQDRALVDVLRVDFGDELGVRKSSAQITDRYEVTELVGRQVLAVVNFPPRQIGPFMSEVLILGLPDSRGNVCLIGPEDKLPDGGRLY